MLLMSKGKGNSNTNWFLEMDTTKQQFQCHYHVLPYCSLKTVYLIYCFIVILGVKRYIIHNQSLTFIKALKFYRILIPKLNSSVINPYLLKRFGIEKRVKKKLQILLLTNDDACFVRHCLAGLDQLHFYYFFVYWLNASIV